LPFAFAVRVSIGDPPASRAQFHLGLAVRIEQRLAVRVPDDVLLLIDRSVLRHIGYLQGIEGRAGLLMDLAL
jgi:hypothetical protein